MAHPAHNVKSRVAAISIFASAAMAAAKLAVGISIGWLALISEALHSLDRHGRHHHHLGGGAGFGPAGGRRAPLRPRQVREPVGARHHRPALCAGRRHSGRSLEPPARRRAAADHLGDPLRRAGDRHRREFLARPRAASRRARHQEPGARRRCAAFRLRRARFLRRHRRPHSRRPRLLVGRCGGRDRGRRDDSACWACR